MSDTFGRPGADGDPATGAGSEGSPDDLPSDRVNLDDPGDDAFAVRTGTPNPPRRLLRGAEQLAHLVGARLLVGITFRDEAGEVVRSDQFCGRVLEVAEGVVVVDRGNEQAVLPADVNAYEVAQPGRYVLQNTGETVLDPDYLTVWNVQVND